MGKQGSTLQPVPMPEPGECTLKGAVTYTESMPQQAAVRSWNLWGNHTETVLEGLYTAERIHAAAILEELHLWEGPHAGTGEEDVEEEAAEEKCY